ncbi:NB-ARC domain-containing disease resistance protein [Zostera marina]|uniref:NB-ARC domain-containing disease resistance protein n=1 Tax=Zostera marina TaxID=29655 RepID=A0A0K9P8N1_ZOSMR|nr:NB-ARC domain-containing disease resistance protein [Zostera marina]
MEENNKIIDEATSFLLNPGEISPPIIEKENTYYINGLPSMERNKKAEYKALEEQNINVIGVFGMGGIGKKTLMQQMNNEMEKRSYFKFVIMNNVGGIVDDQLTTAKENILSRCLEKVKGNILIIFDDVWEPLNFTEIGIPLPNKSCKIIVTTRDQTVCKTMGAKEIIIDALGTDESWKLFESINVGSNKDVDAEVKHAVCKECAGLPLAISVVAKSLNNNKLGEDDWLKSLRYLKNVDPEGTGGRKRIVYMSVELSYDGFEENKLKIYF